MNTASCEQFATGATSSARRWSGSGTPVPPTRHNAPRSRHRRIGPASSRSPGCRPPICALTRPTCCAMREKPTPPSSAQPASPSQRCATTAPSTTSCCSMRAHRDPRHASRHRPGHHLPAPSGDLDTGLQRHGGGCRRLLLRRGARSRRGRLAVLDLPVPFAEPLQRSRRAPRSVTRNVTTPWEPHASALLSPGTEPPSVRRFLRLFGLNHVHHGIDQRQVSERLREVTELTTGVRVEFLRVELERAGERKQLLAQPARPRVLGTAARIPLRSTRR